MTLLMVHPEFMEGGFHQRRTSIRDNFFAADSSESPHAGVMTRSHSCADSQGSPQCSFLIETQDTPELDFDKVFLYSEVHPFISEASKLKFSPDVRKVSLLASEKAVNPYY